MSYRTYVLLEEIFKKHSLSNFGRICQVLLGLTFKDMGFDVPLCQLTGRPDIRATRGSEGYDVEVKAQTGCDAIIKENDIGGVIDSGHKAVIAILTFPDVETKWLMLDAEHLHAGKYNKISLERYSLESLETEVNETFLKTLERCHKYALVGAGCLKRLLVKKYKKRKENTRKIEKTRIIYW